MKRVLLLIMVLVISASLLALGFSGCQQEPAAEEAAEEPAEEAAEEPAEEMEEEPAEEMEEPAEEMEEEEMAEEEPMDLVFGNLPTALSDEWNGYSVENFLYAADLKGVEVQVIDAGWDGAKQLNDLEDLISKGVDAISVFVWTPESAEQFADKAEEAGIPIFFENTKLESDLIEYDFQGNYVFNTATEYDVTGYEAIKWLDENYPGSKIFYVRGMPGMGIVEAYEAGVERALDESTDGTTVAIRRDTQWDTQTAQPEVADVLAAGDEFDVIFANNEAIAQGCYNALKDAGLEGTVPIISTGGGPTGLKLFEEGIIDATVAVPVSVQGLYLFKAMWLYVAKGIEPPEKFIPLPQVVITPDNLDENISWEPSMDLIDYVGGLDSW